MKHWDLTPGETVTLTSDTGLRVKGRFEFRDTQRASFDVDGTPRMFMLRDDGGLEEWRFVEEKIMRQRAKDVYNSAAAVRMARERRLKWFIGGPDRHTRWPEETA